MSDATTRRLTRSAATGDTQAAARLLRDRIRSGDLARARVAYAAALGHSAAREATEPAELPTGADRWTLLGAGRWPCLLAGLRLLSRPEITRYACLVAGLALSRSEPDLEDIGGQVAAARAGIAAALAWADCPCDRHRLGAAALVSGIGPGWLSAVRHVPPAIYAARMAVSTATAEGRRAGYLDSAARAVAYAEFDVPWAESFSLLAEALVS